MVNLLASLTPRLAATHLLVEVEQKAEPLLLKLDPVSRAKVLMTLLGLVLVGIALVALAWLGGRHYLRITRRPLPPTGENQDDWFRKPLVPGEPKTPGPGEGR
jgi:hypothetical protein